MKQNQVNIFLFGVIVFEAFRHIKKYFPHSTNVTGVFSELIA